MSINKNFVISLTFICLLILNACSQKEEVIEINGKDSLKTLSIQKMVENSSSEEMNRMVKDKVKIDKVLTMIEDLEVKEISSEKIFDKMKTQTTYSYNFFENENIESGKEVPYAFSVLDDGTFIFTHKDVGSLQTPRMTTTHHKKLLKEINQLLGIEF